MVLHCLRTTGHRGGGVGGSISNTSRIPPGNTASFGPWGTTEATTDTAEATSGGAKVHGAAVAQWGEEVKRHRGGVGGSISNTSRIPPGNTASFGAWGTT